jgi:parallel beta-helix repeat protein
VEIRSSGNPTLRRNRIHRNAQWGVLIHVAGAGTVEDNDLTDSPGIALHVDGVSAMLARIARNKT